MDCSAIVFSIVHVLSILVKTTPVVPYTKYRIRMSEIWIKYFVETSRFWISQLYANKRA